MSYHSTRRRRGLGVDIVQQGSAADTQSIARGGTGQNLGPLTTAPDNTGSDWAKGITSFVEAGFHMAGAAVRSGQNQPSGPNAPGEPSAADWAGTAAQIEAARAAGLPPPASKPLNLTQYIVPAVAVVGGVGLLVFLVSRFTK